MTILAVVLLLAIAAGAGFVLILHRRPGPAAPRGGARILFPYAGQSISMATLDATLRLARAEGATLVPAYVATIPLELSLEAPLPRQCEQAMPLLETIEQHAARAHVPVDSRIQTGRTQRHALRQLIDHETFDRLVVPAATKSSDGFVPEDVAWLLEHAPGEVLVLRPEASNGDLRGLRRPRGTEVLRTAPAPPGSGAAAS